MTNKAKEYLNVNKCGICGKQFLYKEVKVWTYNFTFEKTKSTT